MKKILNYTILVFFLVFNFNLYVFAYECQYLNGEEKSEKLFVDEEKNKIYFEKNFYDKIEFSSLDHYLDSLWTEDRLIKEYLKGNCPSIIYLCKVTRHYTSPAVTNTDYKPFPLINIDLEKHIKDPQFKSVILYQDVESAISESYILKQGAECYALNYTENGSTADSIETNFPCGVYNDNFYNKMKELACKDINDLTTCNKKNIDDIKKYNKLKEGLRSYCNTKLSESYYYDPCLKACLSLKEDIEKIEGNVYTNTNCGFSGRLILFVGNIIKWCKYIVPVIAIVLSILDFIKAIGAGKEDEMKKAQGKFIKRLIVAGLVFIMPFIIEFVLNKMGFDANGCGIIDL